MSYVEGQSTHMNISRFTDTKLLWFHKWRFFDSMITRFIWCSIMVYTFADQTVVYSFVWFSYLLICFCISILFRQMSFKQWPVEDSVPQIHHYNISVHQVLHLITWYLHETDFFTEYRLQWSSYQMMNVNHCLKG